MKTFMLRIVLGAAVAMMLALSAAAQTPAPTKNGIIKIARAQGLVSKLVGGNPVALKDGDVITESDTVLTGKESSVVLVFMNGSSVRLGADSRLAIDEFKMDPLAEDVDVAKLTNEPSVSKTALNLAYGEVVGDVKHLNKSSTYSIKTPVGAAGIRGTTFRIVFRPTGDGKSFTFSLATSSGEVLFTGTATVATGVSVPTGTEIAVTAEVNEATGAITVSAPVTATTQISQQAVDAVQVATVAITETVQNTTFTTVEMQAPPAPSNPTPPATTPTNPNNTNPDNTNQGTPPPTTKDISVTLTPGAGKT